MTEVLCVCVCVVGGGGVVEWSGLHLRRIVLAVLGTPDQRG